MARKYAIYSHSQARDGKSASEVSQITETTAEGAKGAVEQKIAIDKQRSKMTYKAMMESANEILCATKTVFPFTFFQTAIVVDRNQVNIEESVFWGVQNYYSFLMKDISNIVVRSGIFFSEIEFEVRGYETNPPTFNYLPNKHAEQVKKIVDGIHIAVASQVDVTQLQKSELLNLARKITYRNNFNNAPV